MPLPAQFQSSFSSPLTTHPAPTALQGRSSLASETRRLQPQKNNRFLRSRQRIQGELKSGDRFNGWLSSWTDDYMLRSVKPGQQIEVNLKSNRFDAYLELLDGKSKRVLLYGEDIDVVNSDARIIFTAKPGVRYQLRVSVSPTPARTSKDQGKYVLQSRVIPPVSGNFNFFYGYGLVNAASAVAQAIGKPAFADVAPSGNANWGIDAIKAPAVWAQGYMGQDVVVAVVDTGIDYTHPDLRDNLWTNSREIAGNGFDDDSNGFIDDINGWDFVSQDNDPQDIDGHGTVGAGIIAASGQTGSAQGVAYRAKIMPVRVLSDNEDSQDSTAVANGIRYAVQNGAKVINLSLSSSGARSLFKSLPENEAALQYAQQAGVTVVMASGNDREDYGTLRPIEPAYSATRGFGIAVGAVDRNLQLADFSNPAGNKPLNFVVAPGVDIFSTSKSGGYLADNVGTSFSTPFVSGIAALMLSADPALSPDQIQAIFNATATQNVGLYP
ncbi:MAG TPA: S8 family peptidase [Trichocoleus sp.]